MVDTAETGTAAGLDARYGRTPGRARRDRWIIVSASVLFVAVFTAWVVWAGLDGGQGSLDARDIGHSILDAEHVSITWEVSVAAGTAVSCALQAQNEAHGIVGWKIVDLPSSNRYTRQFMEVVRTTQQSVTGLIYRCWLT